MDDLIPNSKDGAGTSRVRRDPTRVVDLGGPMVRVGSR